MNRDGSAWSIESVVAEFERTDGLIAEAAARAGLAAIRVYVQIEREITI